jgi:hypothetical protein
MPVFTHISGLYLTESTQLLRYEEMEGIYGTAHTALRRPHRDISTRAVYSF